MKCRKEIGRDVSSSQEEDIVFQNSNVTEGNHHKCGLLMSCFEQRSIKMLYKNRFVQISMHLDCCSPSLGTTLESAAKCSIFPIAEKCDREPQSGQRKRSSLQKGVSVSLSIKRRNMVSQDHIKCLPQKLSSSELFFFLPFFLEVLCIYNL